MSAIAVALPDFQKLVQGERFPGLGIDAVAWESRIQAFRDRIATMCHAASNRDLRRVSKAMHQLCADVRVQRSAAGAEFTKAREQIKQGMRQIRQEVHSQIEAERRAILSEFHALRAELLAGTSKFNPLNWTRIAGAWAICDFDRTKARWKRVNPRYSVWLMTILERWERQRALKQQAWGFRTRTTQMRDMEAVLKSGKLRTRDYLKMIAYKDIRAQERMRLDPEVLRERDGRQAEHLSAGRSDKWKVHMAACWKKAAETFGHGAESGAVEPLFLRRRFRGEEIRKAWRRNTEPTVRLHKHHRRTGWRRKPEPTIKLHRRHRGGAWKVWRRNNNPTAGLHNHHL